MLKLATLACALLLLRFSSAGPVVTPPGSKTSRCVPASTVFPKGHVCSTLFPTVTDISIPNPLSDADASNEVLIRRALLEFNNYTVVFQKERFCSDEIYTLLCFFHFPICVDTSAFIPASIRGSTANSMATILPCLGVCERVTAANSSCTQQLLDAQIESGLRVFKTKEGRGWQYFQGCNKTYQSGPKRGSPIFTNDTASCVSQKHNIVMPASTVKVTKGIDICSQIGSTVGSTCSFRKKVSKNVFKNNDYNYSIECLVKNVTTRNGREVIDCLVTGAYSVRCAEPVAEVNTNVTVIGLEKADDSNCFQTEASVEKNKKYIIAGNYIKRKECNDKQWFAARMVSGTDEEGNTMISKRPTIAVSNTKTKRNMCEASKNSCKSKTISC